MEINGNHSILGPNSEVQKPDTQKGRPNPHQPHETSGESQTDRVELSVQGREVQKLNELIQAVPDSRYAKVEAARQAIENGTYNVKAEHVAEKIITGDLLDEIS